MSRMTKVRCSAGAPRSGNLRHTIRETQARRVNALVFVGDGFEEEIDEVCDLAGELGVGGAGVPVPRGNDSIATMAFTQIAKVTGGAHCNLIYPRRNFAICSRR